MRVRGEQAWNAVRKESGARLRRNVEVHSVLRDTPEGIVFSSDLAFMVTEFQFPRPAANPFVR
jgi:hypothetical protein